MADLIGSCGILGMLRMKDGGVRNILLEAWQKKSRRSQERKPNMGQANRADFSARFFRVRERRSALYSGTFQYKPDHVDRRLCTKYAGRKEGCSWVSADFLWM